MQETKFQRDMREWRERWPPVIEQLTREYALLLTTDEGVRHRLATIAAECSKIMSYRTLVLALREELDRLIETPDIIVSTDAPSVLVELEYWIEVAHSYLVITKPEHVATR